MRHNLRTLLFGSLAAIGGVVLFFDPAAARAQNFEANPPDLFFAVQVGDFTGPQTISLTSTGAQMNFIATASVSTPTGVSWLSVSSSSNTTPSILTVSISASGLSPNDSNYHGSITVRRAGSSTQLVIPIELFVFGDRQLAIDTSSFEFSGPTGVNSTPQQIQVIAVGSHPGQLSFRTLVSIDTNTSWLVVSPQQSSTPATLQVTAQPGNLGPGNYAGTITIADTANRTEVVPVSLQLVSSSNISLSTSALTFATASGNSPAPRSVQITNSAGGSLNWTATTAVQSGGNWLSVSPASGIAPSTLTVSVNGSSLTRGIYTGSVTVSSPGAFNSPQRIDVTVAVELPFVNTNGVLNGASFSGDAVVCSSSIASLFGQNLATGTFLFQSFPAPTTLGGTQVLVNDIAAPLFAVSPGQINFQIPAGLTGATARIAVSLNGLRGPDATLNIAQTCPGIFTLSQGGAGQGAVLNGNSSINSSSNPAARGSVIQIYATGLGATDPPLPSGQPASGAEPFNRTTATPIVFVGGAQAQVIFSAMAPTFVGLYQVNVFVPTGIAPGNAVPLQIQIGGRSSNTATVAIN